MDLFGDVGDFGTDVSADVMPTSYTPPITSSDVAVVSSPSSTGDSFFGSIVNGLGSLITSPILTKAAGGALTSWLGVPAHTSNPTVSGSTNIPVAASGMPTGTVLQNGVQTPTYTAQQTMAGTQTGTTMNLQAMLVPLALGFAALIVFKKLFR